jgi:Na+/phosphate symporter
MSYKKPTYLLIGSIFFAFLPLIPTLIAVLIASFFDCTLNEGNAHSCIVFGSDIGDTLYAMGLTFWLALATIQIGVVGLLFSIVWYVIVFLKRSKNG